MLEADGSSRPYPHGQGVREIADLPSREKFERVAGLFAPTLISPTAVKELQINGDDQKVHADMELDPGKQLTKMAIRLAIARCGSMPIRGIMA